MESRTLLASPRRRRARLLCGSTAARRCPGRRCGWSASSSGRRRTCPLRSAARRSSLWAAGRRTAACFPAECLQRKAGRGGARRAGVGTQARSKAAGWYCTPASGHSHGRPENPVQLHAGWVGWGVGERVACWPASEAGQPNRGIKSTGRGGTAAAIEAVPPSGRKAAAAEHASRWAASSALWRVSAAACRRHAPLGTPGKVARGRGAEPTHEQNEPVLLVCPSLPSSQPP